MEMLSHDQFVEIDEKEQEFFEVVQQILKEY